MNDLFSLKGRNAVVTGSSQSLGQAIAPGLARAAGYITVAAVVVDGGWTAGL
jgi:NAD(P)-dependent dehydrogenase (short-subunit alcohol dehydrogenase family)